MFLTIVFENKNPTNLLEKFLVENCYRNKIKGFSKCPQISKITDNLVFLINLGNRITINYKMLNKKNY